MPIITTAIIKAVAPSCKEPEVWTKVFRELFSSNTGFDTPQEIASFLSQTAHESGDFNTLEENLNYSAEGLLKTWPKRFDPKTAAESAKNPSAIANIVYANRLGNGDTASGDGYRYRGRGLIQITGKSAYNSFMSYCGVDVIAKPDLVSQDKSLALSSAVYFWETNIRGKVNMSDIVAVTKRVNGGNNGLSDRTRRYVACIKLL